MKTIIAKGESWEEKEAENRDKALEFLENIAEPAYYLGKKFENDLEDEFGELDEDLEVKGYFSRHKSKELEAATFEYEDRIGILGSVELVDPFSEVMNSNLPSVRYHLEIARYKIP